MKFTVDKFLTEKKCQHFFNYPDLQDRLIVLDGWSKAYSMTGWRMGWSVWPESLISHVTKLAINSFSCVNAPSQFAGIAALDGPDDSIHHMMEKFDQRRKLIHKGLMIYLVLNAVCLVERFTLFQM